MVILMLQTIKEIKDEWASVYKEAKAEHERDPYAIYCVALAAVVVLLSMFI